MHVISFLLQMGFREVGVPFPLEGLNPLQANIAAQLSQLGLLMPFRCPFLLPHAFQVPPLSALCPSGAPSFCLMPFRCPLFLPHALQVPLFLPNHLLLIAQGAYTKACDTIVCQSISTHTDCQRALALGKCS